MFASGITDRLYAPQEDARLLDFGIGFTNLCPRPTRRAADLTREEIEAGAAALHTRLERYKPRAVAYTGIGVLLVRSCRRFLVLGDRDYGASRI